MRHYTDTINLAKLYESVTTGFSAEGEISKAIREVQNSDVFFSKIIAGMKVIATASEPTMATDGKNLFYNPEYVKKLIQTSGLNESVQGIIVHKILHIAFGHHLAFAKELDEAVKTNNENLKWLVNVACDLAINDFLKGRAGFPKDVFIPGVNPNEEPFKSFPPNKDARWYFNQLLDFYKKQPPTTPPPDQGQDQQNDQDNQDQEDNQTQDQGSDQSQGGQEGSEGQQGSDEQQQGDSKPDQGGEQGSDQDGKTKDQSGDGKDGSGKSSDDAEGQESEGLGDGEGSGSEGGSATPQSAGDKVGDIPEDLLDKYKKTGEILPPADASPEEAESKLQEHEQDMKEFEKDARKIEQAKRERGIGSGGGAYSNIDYGKYIKDISRIPWNQIINEFLSENERSETTYRRPSRRMSGLSFTDFYADTEEEIVMPSRYEEKLNELIFIVDVSGSNQVAANNVFPEMKEAINASGFGNQSALRLVSFNTRIEDEYVFSFNPKSDYKSLKFLGRDVPKEKIIIPDGNDLIKDSDINRFQWRVGGGTRISPVFEALNTLKDQPPFIVILTDGEFTHSEIAMLNQGQFKFKIIWIMTVDNGIQFQGYKTYKLYDMDY